MAYFVTGATGFIGRRLVEQLLCKRQGKVYVLVREASTGRLEAQIEHWQAVVGASFEKRVVPVIGDLRKPLLGVETERVEELRGKIEHFFHLAAIYDMTAPAEQNTAVNVGGTTHAVELARAINAERLHHVSSIAVAGEYKGTFEEEMFDEDTKLPSPYHRTKFESERIVREQPYVPWRVYRPGIVVGDSRTGEMDKIDGPYYFFKAIKMARHYLPAWFPLIGPELGYTNVVPVDFVADAMDYIAHQPGLDGRAFHLTNPKSQRSSELMNIFAKAAHAPEISIRIDPRMLGGLPKATFSLLGALPAAGLARRVVLSELGIPRQVLEYVGLSARFDTTHTQRVLGGSGLFVPPISAYADKLWDYWERNLDPDLFKDAS